MRMGMKKSRKTGTKFRIDIRSVVESLLPQTWKENLCERLTKQIFKEGLYDLETSSEVRNDSIGPYEFWGFKGVDSRPDYLSGSIKITIDLKKQKGSFLVRNLLADYVHEAIGEYEELDSDLKEAVAEEGGDTSSIEFDFSEPDYHNGMVTCYVDFTADLAPYEPY